MGFRDTSVAPVISGRQDGTTPVVGDQGQVIGTDGQGRLLVAIDANNLNQLDVDIVAQTIGDIDFNFAAQDAGVADAPQFAAEQNAFDSAIISGTAPSSGVLTVLDTVTNNSGSANFVEVLTLAVDEAYTDSVFIQLTVNVAVVGEETIFRVNPPQMPLFLDPGIRWISGEDVDVSARSHSGSDVDLAGSVIWREQ